MEAVTRATSMPARSSSSGVPMTATRSPATTGWSRPGQQAISPPSAGTTATGASWPKWLRNVGWNSSSVSTRTWTTAKRVPPSSTSWED